MLIVDSDKRQWQGETAPGCRQLGAVARSCNPATRRLRGEDGDGLGQHRSRGATSTGRPHCARRQHGPHGGVRWGSRLPKEGRTGSEGVKPKQPKVPAVSGRGIASESGEISSAAARLVSQTTSFFCFLPLPPFFLPISPLKSLLHHGTRTLS